MRTVVPFVAYMFLVAFAGYFTGASIGLHCAEANKWVLSLAAGFFVYVALVDLVRPCCTVFAEYCNVGLDYVTDLQVKIFLFPMITYMNYYSLGVLIWWSECMPSLFVLD